MHLEIIDSPQNPAIKAAAKLRSSRGRRKSGQIIVDGSREIERAVDRGIVLESLFLPQGSAIPPFASRAKRVFSVSPRAMEKIAFGNRTEPVAVAPRPDVSLARLPIRNQSPLYIVLDSVEKPGNIGAAVRTADGAGLDGVVLVNALADPYNPNAIRASLGTVFSVPIAICSLNEYYSWAKKHGIQTVLAICDPQTKDYRDMDYLPPTAIVLGNEANGLDEEWINLGNIRKLAIPMVGIADSLNVSAAAAVLMYEAVSQRRASNEKK